MKFNLTLFVFVVCFSQKALNLPAQNPSHLVQARLACLTRALDRKRLTIEMTTMWRNPFAQRGNCQNSFQFTVQFTNKMLFLNAMIWQTEIKWKWCCLLIHSRFWYTLTHTLYDILMILSVHIALSASRMCGKPDGSRVAGWLAELDPEREGPLDPLGCTVMSRMTLKTETKRKPYGVFLMTLNALNTLNTGSLCSLSQEVLHDIFLLDGHEQKTFVFLYLPLFLTNAKVNHDVDLLGALKFLVEIYDRLLQHRCLMLTGLGPRSMSSGFPMDFRISNPKPCEVHRSGWICHHWLWWWKTSKIFPHYEPRFKKNVKTVELETRVWSVWCRWLVLSGDLVFCIPFQAYSVFSPRFFCSLLLSLSMLLTLQHLSLWWFGCEPKHWKFSLGWFGCDMTITTTYMRYAWYEGHVKNVEYKSETIPCWGKCFDFAKLVKHLGSNLWFSERWTFDQMIKSFHRHENGVTVLLTSNSYQVMSGACGCLTAEHSSVLIIFIGFVSRSFSVLLLLFTFFLAFRCRRFRISNGVNALWEVSWFIIPEVLTCFELSCFGCFGCFEPASSTSNMSYLMCQRKSGWNSWLHNSVLEAFVWNRDVVWISGTPFVNSEPMVNHVSYVSGEKSWWTKFLLPRSWAVKVEIGVCNSILADSKPPASAIGQSFLICCSHAAQSFDASDATLLKT